MKIKINKFSGEKKAYVIAFLLIVALPFFALSEGLSDLHTKEILGKEYYEYEIGKNETLYGIAKKFDWDVEELIRLNPETAKNLKKGLKLYYPKENGNMNLDSSNNDLNNFNSKAPITHKVKKGETVYGIAHQYGVTLESIYTANPSSTHGIKPGEILEIPLDGNFSSPFNEKDESEAVLSYEEFNPDPVTNYSDQISYEKMKEIGNETNKEGTDNFYEATSNIEESDETLLGTIDSDSSLNEEGSLHVENVRVALLLDDPSSKKDIDFTRGALIALSDLKDLSYKINFKVIDGRISSAALSDTLDMFEPNLIFTTADKAFPLFLADYGNSNNSKVINVFDLKNDLYEDNVAIVQLLSPSAIFNEGISEKLYSDNRYRKLLLVGEMDENDGMAIELMKKFGNESEILSIEELNYLEPDVMQSLLVYAYPSKKEEVADFLLAIDNLRENFPGADLKIAGRSSWITMVDDFGDKFKEEGIYIPARVWLEENSDSWTSFCEKYEEMFAGDPVRSFPNFAATGYDVINYFVPAIYGYGSSSNSKLYNDSYSPLQQDINLKQESEWSGYINTTGYLLKYNKDGEIEKIIVK